MLEQFMQIMPVLFFALLLWLAGLSFMFYRLQSHYNKLGKGVKSQNLIKIIEDQISEIKKTKSDVSELGNFIAKMDRSNALNIQKIGLLRFNPFHETGGDQSFSLCLLDRDENGFVLTCLHTRDRTRVYAKPIQKAVSEYELSNEEMKALKLAQKHG